MITKEDYEKWDKSTIVPAEDMAFIEDFNRQLKEKEKSNYKNEEVTNKTKIWRNKKMTEQINDITVGDEIRTGIEGRNAINSVVHLIGNRGDCLVYQCITAGGHHHTCTSNDDIRKTGRHFPQIAEVLKEMQSV